MYLLTYKKDENGITLSRFITESELKILYPDSCKILEVRGYYQNEEVTIEKVEPFRFVDIWK